MNSKNKQTRKDHLISGVNGGFLFMEFPQGHEEDDEVVHSDLLPARTLSAQFKNSLQNPCPYCSEEFLDAKDLSRHIDYVHLFHHFKELAEHKH